MIYIVHAVARPVVGRIVELEAAVAARGLSRAMGRSAWVLIVGRSEVAVVVAPHRRPWELLLIAPRVGRVMRGGRLATYTILDAVRMAWPMAAEALRYPPWSGRREALDRALVLAAIKMVESGGFMPNHTIGGGREGVDHG